MQALPRLCNPSPSVSSPLPQLGTLSLPDRHLDSPETVLFLPVPTTVFIPVAFQIGTFLLSLPPDLARLSLTRKTLSDHLDTLTDQEATQVLLISL